MKPLFVSLLLAAALLPACNSRPGTETAPLALQAPPIPEDTAKLAVGGTWQPDPGTEGVAGVTMAGYNRLKPGMSYAAASAILGGDGTELSSNDIGGTHTVMYQWKGGFMANMNAMFQGDKLITKAQFGLR